MIRRGFWLAVGAAGGIAGYRRAVSLRRRALGTLSSRRARAQRQGWLREATRFASDVREGMDLYIARHPGSAGPTLGASTRTDEKDVR